MSPIRVAIIGLSSSASTSWASGAHLPYLLSPRGKQRYTIVALLNSSVDAARAAIKHYNLDSSTVKPYGDPDSLAADPDVDLVVNCTRVDVHHPSVLPSVKAGKNAFVEWPLANNVTKASELADLVKGNGAKSVVGLQGRFAPPVEKLREIIEEGRIGKVVSSEVRGYGGTNDRGSLPPGLAYFTDRTVGGNVYTIGFGHLFDQVQHVLGDFTELNSHFHLQRPQVAVRGTSDILTSTVPDLIITTSRLPATPHTQENASVLYRFRRGQPYPGEPALVWTIAGEKGEIKLVAQEGTTLHASAYAGPVTIHVHDFATDEVKEVGWKWEDWQEELPMIARSVGRLYEAYAGGEKVPTFGDAVRRHEQLEGALATWTQ